MDNRGISSRRLCAGAHKPAHATRICQVCVIYQALVMTRLINEVRGINRVVYDISNKPPAMIKWE